MPTALPFTKARIRKAIEVAEEKGYRVGGITANGTVLIFQGDDRPEHLSIAPDHEQATGGTSWDDR